MVIVNVCGDCTSKIQRQCMVIVNVIVKVGKQQKRWLSHKQCMVIVNVCGDCISKIQRQSIMIVNVIVKVGK